MSNLATKNVNDFTVTETGEAFISQRKAAELLGVPNTTIQSFIKSRAPNVDTSQGLTPDLLQNVVQYYAFKGNKTCQEFMGKLLEAGAKAYIYHEAGYTVNAAPPPPPPKSALELAKEQVVLLENMERLELELKQSKNQLAITSQCLDESQTQLNMNREWASVKFVETKFKIKVDWRIVKSWNDHYGMEKKYIEDQNYGRVRTYHASAWKSSYNITI